ncbi:hypothetical protein ACFOD4_06035 [Pseudoroseomonas globiformis]|uniref:MFS transporter n=1 Tax=Teichococcus globiformis TaxID=2307229 RepID=A0ABV7G2S1_9PROT
MRDRFSLRLRSLRGALLVLFALPLPAALLISLFGGDQRAMLGLALGLGALALAWRWLRRGRVRPAALLVGAATALIGGLAGGIAPFGALLFGVMAGFGTKMLYTDAPPAEAEPAPPPQPDLLAGPSSRLAALEAADARLRPAVFGLRELVNDMALRPDGGTDARRFLNLQLDGLERIEVRLRQGIEPPHGLAPLVDDMARGSQALRERLRNQEQEALEIQVKVLADRLREEGYA